jgi:hypothetical protein
MQQFFCFGCFLMDVKKKSPPQLTIWFDLSQRDQKQILPSFHLIPSFSHFLPLRRQIGHFPKTDGRFERKWAAYPQSTIAERFCIDDFDSGALPTLSNHRSSSGKQVMLGSRRVHRSIDRSPACLPQMILWLLLETNICN